MAHGKASMYDALNGGMKVSGRRFFSELTKDADTENLSIDSRKSIFAKGIKTSYNRAHR
jgi:hypothetical protein